MSFAQTLRDRGITYLSFDMAATVVRLTAWSGSERKTFQSHGPSVEAAEAALIERLNRYHDDFEDLL